MHNSGHYTGFLAGIIVGIFTEIVRFTSRKNILK